MSAEAVASTKPDSAEEDTSLNRPQEAQNGGKQENQNGAPVNTNEPVPEPTKNGEAEQQELAVRPSSLIKEKSPSPVGGSGGDSCCVCTKKVYPLEKLVAEKNLFHKNCFRCKKCSRILNNSNYATLNGDYYCKPHQMELFRLQGRYEVSDTPAEIVNRSSSTDADAPTPTNDALVENNPDELRRARAVFEQKAADRDQPPPSPSPSTGGSDLVGMRYSGVGALKSRFIASTTPGTSASDSSRPPLRKITPPRHPDYKTNGNEAKARSADRGESENEPVQIDGVVRESDRAQFEAELPKQGCAKSALALFRNLETSTSGKPSTIANVNASEQQEMPDGHDPAPLEGENGRNGDYSELQFCRQSSVTQQQIRKFSGAKLAPNLAHLNGTLNTSGLDKVKLEIARTKGGVFENQPLGVDGQIVRSAASENYQDELSELLVVSVTKQARSAFQQAEANVRPTDATNLVRSEIAGAGGGVFENQPQRFDHVVQCTSLSENDTANFQKSGLAKRLLTEYVTAVSSSTTQSGRTFDARADLASQSGVFENQPARYANGCNESTEPEVTALFGSGIARRLLKEYVNCAAAVVRRETDADEIEQLMRAAPAKRAFSEYICALQASSNDRGRPPPLDIAAEFNSAHSGVFQNEPVERNDVVSGRSDSESGREVAELARFARAKSALFAYMEAVTSPKSASGPPPPAMIDLAPDSGVFENKPLEPYADVITGNRTSEASDLPPSGGEVRATRSIYQQNIAASSGVSRVNSSDADELSNVRQQADVRGCAQRYLQLVIDAESKLSRYREPARLVDLDIDESGGVYENVLPNGRHADASGADDMEKEFLMQLREKSAAKRTRERYLQQLSENETWPDAAEVPQMIDIEAEFCEQSGVYENEPIRSSADVHRAGDLGDWQRELPPPSLARALIYHFQQQ